MVLSLKNLKLQRGNSGTMGQRQGFASSDLAKINKMYKCSNSPVSPTQVSGNRPTFVRPTFEKPSRPSISGSTGGGGSSGSGYTNPIAQFVSGIGNIFSAFGGKNDASDDLENHNSLEDY